MTQVVEDARIGFSTDTLDPHSRDAEVREFYGRICMRLDLEPLDEEGLRLSASTAILPGMSVTRGAVASMSWQRNTALMTDGNDDLAISWMSGGYQFDRRGRATTETAPGAPCLMPMDQAWKATTGNGDWTVCVQVSRSLLEPLVANLGDLAPDAIKGETPAARLLLDYATAVTRTPLSSGVADMASKHIADLLAFALGAGTEARPRAGVQAARRRALEQHVQQNLHRPHLSAETAGRALNLSPRYIRSLFASQGQSFSDYVTERRLECVLRRLSDPRFALSSIAEVAFATGWAEPSTFYRQFKARYGMTPSEVRPRPSSS